MIRGIDVENFKCFSKLNMSLKPLTLLTGFNGAGKSTSIQPILLLSQHIRDRPSTDILPLNGPLVQLGTAGEVICSFSPGPIQISFSSIADSARWILQYDRHIGRRELRLQSSDLGDECQGTPQWLPNGSKNSICTSLANVIYLSALRQEMVEGHSYPNVASEILGDVGPLGQYAAYWYVRLSDEEVSEQRRHPTEERITVRGQIDAWLAELFPDARVNADELPGVSLARVSFNLGKSREWRRPVNVGYGLSYVFPLLVALVCARAGQTVIIDSPEAHLHPYAQSIMGQILAHFAGSGLQIIVESHSDHLLSGMRLSVKRGVIDGQDAKIHFFGRKSFDQAEGRRYELQIEEDGSIDNWPDGFFDQSLLDLARLA